MSSVGENGIPKGCAVGVSYYGGLYCTSCGQARKEAEACASALTRKTGRPHDVKHIVENASDGLPVYVPENWFKVINGRSRGGNVKIEERERAVPFTERIANAWHGFWAQ